VGQQVCEAGFDWHKPVAMLIGSSDFFRFPGVKVKQHELS